MTEFIRQQWCLAAVAGAVSTVRMCLKVNKENLRAYNIWQETKNCYKIVRKYFNHIEPKIEIYHKKTIKISIELKNYWNGSNEFSEYTKYKMHAEPLTLPAGEAAASSRGHSITHKVFIWPYLWYLFLVYARIWNMCRTRLLYQPAQLC